MKNFRKLDPKIDKLKPGDHWIEVTNGMSGYFAVDMWINGEEKTLGPFPEPWNTGFGRYATEQEAIEEAICWAYAEEMPWNLPITQEQADEMIKKAESGS